MILNAWTLSHVSEKYGESGNGDEYDDEYDDDYYDDNDNDNHYHYYISSSSLLL